MPLKAYVWLKGQESTTSEMEKENLTEVSTESLELLRNKLVEKGWTVSTAESCTSGRIATFMSLVSGSSNFYQGGIVAYQNSVKTAELNVPSEMIEKYDVVSEPVVKAMVEGACRKFCTSFALASTGYAEGWEGHEVEIWIGWGAPDDLHTLHLTKDYGRVKNVEMAAARVVHEFEKYIIGKI